MKRYHCILIMGAMIFEDLSIQNYMSTFVNW